MTIHEAVAQVLHQHMREVDDVAFAEYVNRLAEDEGVRRAFELEARA